MTPFLKPLIVAIRAILLEVNQSKYSREIKAFFFGFILILVLWLGIEGYSVSDLIALLFPLISE